MQIRSEQIKEMGEEHERKFVDRLVKLVTDDDSQESDNLAVRNECQNLMRKAGDYGFTTEFEIAAFVACGFEFGNAFETRPEWVFHSILMEPDTEARLKAAQLMLVLENPDSEFPEHSEPT